jgi:hypothetical protein
VSKAQSNGPAAEADAEYDALDELGFITMSTTILVSDAIHLGPADIKEKLSVILNVLPGASESESVNTSAFTYLVITGNVLEPDFRLVLTGPENRWRAKPEPVPVDWNGSSLRHDGFQS